MADALHSILHYAESLEMPEGQYLKVANALRDAFHQMPKKKSVQEWHDYPLPENYLKIRLRKPFVADTFEEVCIAYLHVFVSNARHPGPSLMRTKVRVEYLSPDKPSVIKEYNQTERSNTFDTVTELYEPRYMTIEWDGVSYSYEYESMLRTMKQDHEMLKDINNDEEEDEDTIYWNHTNFYNAVNRRTMEILKNYFWTRFHQEFNND
jgi:hypothetical protein